MGEGDFFCDCKRFVIIFLRAIKKRTKLCFPENPWLSVGHGSYSPTVAGPLLLEGVLGVSHDAVSRYFVSGSKNRGSHELPGNQGSLVQVFSLVDEAILIWTRKQASGSFYLSLKNHTVGKLLADGEGEERRSGLLSQSQQRRPVSSYVDRRRGCFLRRREIAECQGEHGWDLQRRDRTWERKSASELELRRVGKLNSEVL